MTYYGYAGKILRLDMTNRKAIAIETEPYRRWGGGHGMGAALFWDFCKDKTITDGRDPANVCCVMTSPLCGTIVPSAGGRCEVVGVGVGQYPSLLVYPHELRRPILDHAQIRRDGTGSSSKAQADRPVWVDIRNDQVIFHDAEDLWGKDTWTTQLEIRKLLGFRRGTKIPLEGP